jgi:hypothetical protein
VARDEPQVSVGGLLDRKFWKQFCSFDTVLGKILSIGKVCGRRRKVESVQLRCIQEDSVQKEESVQKEDNAQKKE